MLTFSTPLPTSPAATGQCAHADPPTAASQPVNQPVASSREIDRLLTAAVVSRRFRQLLLADPLAALRSGYNGTDFRLTLDEINLVQSIHATTLPDFAAQLLERAGDRFGKRDKEHPVDAEPAAVPSARNEEQRMRPLRYA